MIVMDDTSCMVDVAKYFMDFCREESCGKCVPCRVGTSQLWLLLDAITRGDATEADLASMERLADMVRRTSLCGLGQGAPNPIFSTLRYFRDEYTAHIVDRACPAGVCPIGEGGARHERPHAPGRRGRRRGCRGPVDPRRRAGERDRDPDDVPPPRPVGDGLVPGVRRRGRGHGQAVPGLHDGDRGGHAGHDEHAAARGVPPHRRGDAVPRAASRVLGVRREQPLRAPGPVGDGGPRPLRAAADQPQGRRSTHRTRCSPSTTAAASCASAASGSVPRSRAPAPGA